MLFISQTLCHSCLHFHCTLIKLEDICLVFYDLQHPCFFAVKIIILNLVSSTVNCTQYDGCIQLVHP